MSLVRNVVHIAERRQNENDHFPIIILPLSKSTSHILAFLRLTAIHTTHANEHFEHN
jgi:hypothetical protein